MASVEWMFTDGELAGTGLGRLNRMLWSSQKTIEATRSELMQSSAQSYCRQVNIKLRTRGMIVKQAFSGVESTVVGLDFLESALDERVAGDDTCSQVDRAIDRYSSICGSMDHSFAKARWMWDDAGLSGVLPMYSTFAKKNPFRWSEWQRLADVAQSLQSISETVASRCAKLEVSTTTKLGSPVIVSISMPVADLVALLLEIISGRTIGARSRVASVEEMFFFPMDLERAIEDAEQALHTANKRIEKQEIEVRTHNVELADMLERTARQRKLKTAFLADVAPRPSRNNRRARTLHATSSINAATDEISDVATEQVEETSKLDVATRRQQKHYTCLADQLQSEVRRRHLSAEAVFESPPVRGSRKRVKSLGEELQGAVRRRTVRLQEA